VETHIADAIARGASILTGGKRHVLGHSFFQPTVLAGVNQNMRIAAEETFGPVAPLFEFSSDEEVVQLANATEFGLAAYFYSRDIGRIWRVAEALEYGMVGINTRLISNEVVPFGGVKQSGFGREGSHYGIEEYVVVKYLCMGGL
jgi:succinate-semialdehyde dehydrogenase/glutarate-semialdehyde dehydrogenase